MLWKRFTRHSKQMQIEAFDVVFWDFDGTIKDSVDVKSDAFEKLFLPYGVESAKRVRVHHEENGGLSRFKKIPLYLEWVGEEVTERMVQQFCSRFSELAFQGVIDSPWVDEAYEYLLQNYQKQYFVLVTATPQEEIELIADRLDIACLFKEIYGAPHSKADMVAAVMGRLNMKKEQALIIGDAETDMLAAEENGITFLLRATSINQHIQKRHKGSQF